MKDRDVEAAVRQVYDFCPPTVTRYSDEGRTAYEQAWAAFMTALDLGPDRLRGARLLDVGCGSAEKATFYHDWGAHVTGVDMTPAVLERAKETIGDRPIRLIHSSLFDLSLNERFDVVVSDGVLHHTGNTLKGLRWCVDHLEPGGQLMFALVNVWGSFWWFKPARAVTYALGGRDYHARARWGQRLFGRLRGGQEGSEQNSFFRSTQSWAYDWFGNPRWSAHSPGEIRRWLDELNLDYIGSVPSLMVKRPPATWYQRLFRRVSGGGPAAMGWYWLLCGEPNMVYVTGRKRR